MAKTMDVTPMFSKIMMSNCNGGNSDNNLSPEEVAELVQIGTTFVRRGKKSKSEYGLS